MQNVVLPVTNIIRFSAMWYDRAHRILMKPDLEFKFHTILKVSWNAIFGRIKLTE